MLVTRELPLAEWDRLTAIEPFRSAGLPARERAGDWVVLVVERDGAMVGTCSLFTAVHWDCWWVDPAARGRGGVLAQLLDATLARLRASDVRTVYTGAEDARPELAALLEGFGFTPAPGRLFVLDVAAVDRRRQEG